VASQSEAAMLERVLRHDRVITSVGLALLCALAWLYLLTGAGLGMSMSDMATLSLFPHKAAEAAMSMSMPMSAAEMRDMAMGPPAWSPGLWALTTAMWWTMMVAMMTPSAAPTILLYGRTHRHALAHDQAAGLAPVWAFAAGYLLVWLGFSLAAAGLHWGLERADLVSTATMGSRSRWLSGVVLMAAGAYQLSPLQQACLGHCRSPAAFLARHWRPGALGAVRLGVLHGTYCVGCCWMLMALLFVGGVMNLAWIAALTLLVMAEKVLPGGPWVARACGVVMLAWGAATLLV
jgi:predicted metal-binding membrane protein